MRHFGDEMEFRFDWYSAQLAPEAIEAGLSHLSPSSIEGIDKLDN